MHNASCAHLAAVVDGDCGHCGASGAVCQAGRKALCYSCVGSAIVARSGAGVAGIHAVAGNHFPGPADLGADLGNDLVDLGGDLGAAGLEDQECCDG